MGRRKWSNCWKCKRKHTCVFIVRGFFCLSSLSFACLPQLNPLIQVRLQWPNSVSLQKRGCPHCGFASLLQRICRETELGHCSLESMDWAEAGKQRKAKKGRRNHEKDTGMFAFTFSTITSFPATHDLRHHLFIFIQKLCSPSFQFFKNY